MNKTSKILLGFTTGALAGIVMGLLLAPDKKSEKLRATIKQEGDPEKDLSSFFERTNDEYDCVKQEMEK